MSDKAFDGYGCVDEAEKAWQGLLAISRLGGTGITEHDGIGWCVRKAFETARLALERCPVQPGDRVEIAKRYDCSGTRWAQHQFEVGARAEVVYVQLLKSGYAASIRFEHEYETEPEHRHLYAGVPVEYLRKVESNA